MSLSCPFPTVELSPSNNDLNECYYKITNLIHAVINNGSKDYDLNYIRNHVERLTS